MCTIYSVLSHFTLFCCKPCYLLSIKDVSQILDPRSCCWMGYAAKSHFCPIPSSKCLQSLLFCLDNFMLNFNQVKKEKFMMIFCLFHLVSRSRRSLSKISFFFNAKWFHRFIIIHANCVKSYFVHHGIVMLNGDGVSYAQIFPHKFVPSFVDCWIVPSFVLQRSRNLYSTVHQICQELNCF